MIEIEIFFDGKKGTGISFYPHKEREEIINKIMEYAKGHIGKMGKMTIEVGEGWKKTLQDAESVVE